MPALAWLAMAEMNLVAARRALDDCDAVVDRLHERCCEPSRSPRMLAIKAAIESVRTDLESAPGDAEATDRALAGLADIGSQIGWLQTGCCTSARMPLYGDALGHLNSAQLRITAAAARGH